MGEGDLVEQYQGAIVAESLEFRFIDNVFYAPSQRVEFDEYVQMGHLPDGRRVVQSTWLACPINRIGIEVAIANLHLRDKPLE